MLSYKLGESSCTPRIGTHTELEKGSGVVRVAESLGLQNVADYLRRVSPSLASGVGLIQRSSSW